MAIINKLLNSPHQRYESKHREIFEEKVRHHADAKSRFTKIYQINMWGAEDGITETVSGPGSTLAHTESIRETLPRIFEKFKINSVIDAGCGDFNWMQQVVRDAKIHYTGADIVDELIERNNDLYAADNIQFVVLDITCDPIPKADLLICRECLFHLSNKSIFEFFHNFAQSEIQYLLTTTYDDDAETFENEDVITGFFREIDLFSPPFNLPGNTLGCYRDTSAGKPKRKLCLWRREQIAETLETIDASSGDVDEGPRDQLEPSAQ